MNPLTVRDFFEDWTPWKENAHIAQWRPKVDLQEYEDKFLLEMDLPGFKKEDITLEIHGTLLTLKGKKETDKEGQYFRRERITGTFERNFDLGQRVDQEKVEASLNEGVLTLKLPKREEALPKRIKIDVA